MDAIRRFVELQGNGDEAEAKIIVAIRSLVVVAVSGTAVPGIVVPAAAADHTIPTLWYLTFIFKKS